MTAWTDLVGRYPSLSHDDMVWADPSWSPFGVADEPVYEPEIEFGTAGAATFDITETFLPVLNDTGAPILEWEVVSREALGDGDTVRVTQVGRWKGTRLTGKTVHYERKTSA